MEQIDPVKRRGTKMPCNVVVSLIFLSLIVLALAVFSGYLFNQLNYQQQQFNSLRKQVNGQSLAQTESTLLRQERGLDGTDRSRNNRDDQVGNNGRPSLDATVVSSVAFIHWGKRTCPSRSLSMFEGVEGTIAAYHDQSNNIVAGSDVFCVTNSNDIDRQRQATRGLKFQPAEFNLYGHSQHFPYSNKKGFLYCNHCFVEGSDVITLIGRSCPTPEWQSLYSGFMTTSFGVLGTSQSICVTSDALPVSSNLFYSSLRSMSPVMSGRVSPINRQANKIIPCSVCYREPSKSVQTQGSQGRGGSNTDEYGARGRAGAQGVSGARGRD